MRSLDPTDPPAIGGYPLLARLGAGGMGQVYLSRTPSGRPLALKTVRAEYGEDPDFARRFAREITSSDRVRSPWAASVVDYSPPGGRPQWLATEYVAAPALSDWVRLHGPLPEPAVRALALELAEGLGTVHRACLTHRDVKPSNVLLAQRRPLLIDFGIARAADDTRHTRTGGVIGSPGYMPPEQVTTGTSAEPGDIFALGAVLVYAATGGGPFQRTGEESSAARLLYRVVHEEPALDGVPRSLAPLLAACLSKSPQARPTTEELRGRLGAGAWDIALTPGLTEDIGAREAELWGLLERSASGAGFGPTPVMATASYEAPTTYGPPPADPSKTAPRPASRLRPAAIAVGAVAVVAAVAALAWLNGGQDGADENRHPSPASDALPASWVGTWKGTSAGSLEGDGVLNPRTTSASVTFTLHAARRGELAGRQVSHETDADSGKDLGCTETLRLQETHGTTMIFEAVTGSASDPTSAVLCLRGNVYALTMTGPDTLAVGDETTQTQGEPTHYTRVS
ncbi:serine/threonine-protein kinase [Streptomyces sp. 4F14]|uniref:serine/threonine-protein kinase n=1 Tax=Streptomyces sp. 4F14 TaxID=3394380 RepID=UPI003A8B9778